VTEFSLCTTGAKSVEWNLYNIIPYITRFIHVTSSLMGIGRSIRNNNIPSCKYPVEFVITESPHSNGINHERLKIFQLLSRILQRPRIDESLSINFEMGKKFHLRQWSWDVTFLLISSLVFLQTNFCLILDNFLICRHFEFWPHSLTSAISK